MRCGGGGGWRCENACAEKRRGREEVGLEVLAGRGAVAENPRDMFTKHAPCVFPVVGALVLLVLSAPPRNATDQFMTKLGHTKFCGSGTRSNMYNAEIFQKQGVHPASPIRIHVIFRLVATGTEEIGSPIFKKDETSRMMITVG